MNPPPARASAPSGESADANIASARATCARARMTSSEVTAAEKSAAISASIRPGSGSTARIDANETDNSCSSSSAALSVNLAMRASRSMPSNFAVEVSPSSRRERSMALRASRASIATRDAVVTTRAAISERRSRRASAAVSTLAPINSCAATSRSRAAASMSASFASSQPIPCMIEAEIAVPPRPSIGIPRLIAMVGSGGSAVAVARARAASRRSAAARTRGETRSARAAASSASMFAATGTATVCIGATFSREAQPMKRAAIVRTIAGTSVRATMGTTDLNVEFGMRFSPRGRKNRQHAFNGAWSFRSGCVRRESAQAAGEARHRSD